MGMDTRYSVIDLYESDDDDVKSSTDDDDIEDDNSDGTPFIDREACVIIENVKPPVNCHGSLNNLNIPELAANNKRRLFLPDPRLCGFRLIFIYENSDSARKAAIRVNRKTLYGRPIFASVLFDCIENITELERAYEKCSNRLPPEALVTVTDIVQSTPESELRNLFSSFGDVIELDLMGSLIFANNFANVKYKFLSEAFAAEFGIEMLYDDEICATAPLNIDELCRDLLRGSFRSDHENREETVILPEYITRGRKVKDDFSLDNVSKCNILDCPICEN